MAGYTECHSSEVSRRRAGRVCCRPVPRLGDYEVRTGALGLPGVFVVHGSFPCCVGDTDEAGWRCYAIHDAIL